MTQREATGSKAISYVSAFDVIAPMDTAVTEATIAVRESPTRSSVGML